MGDIRLSAIAMARHGWSSNYPCPGCDTIGNRHNGRRDGRNYGGHDRRAAMSDLHTRMTNRHHAMTNNQTRCHDHRYPMIDRDAPTHLATRNVASVHVALVEADLRANDLSWEEVEAHPQVSCTVRLW